LNLGADVDFGAGFVDELAIDHDFSGLDQALCLLARVTESTIYE